MNAAEKAKAFIGALKGTDYDIDILVDNIDQLYANRSTTVIMDALEDFANTKMLSENDLQMIEALQNLEYDKLPFPEDTTKLLEEIEEQERLMYFYEREILIKMQESDDLECRLESLREPKEKSRILRCESIRAVYNLLDELKKSLEDGKYFSYQNLAEAILTTYRELYHSIVQIIDYINQPFDCGPHGIDLISIEKLVVHGMDISMKQFYRNAAEKLDTMLKRNLQISLSHSNQHSIDEMRHELQKSITLEIDHRLYEAQTIIGLLYFLPERCIQYFELDCNLLDVLLSEIRFVIESLEINFPTASSKPESSCGVEMDNVPDALGDLQNAKSDLKELMSMLKDNITRKSLFPNFISEPLSEFNRLSHKVSECIQSYSNSHNKQ